MRILSGEEETAALWALELAAETAKSATCTRSRCGSIIVKDEIIIGMGYNSPPNDHENQRRCSSEKSSYPAKVTDKTCCMHAEQRAVIDALQYHPEKLSGSRLYFMRLDEQGNKKRSGEPYCTICS